MWHLISIILFIILKSVLALLNIQTCFELYCDLTDTRSTVGCRYSREYRHRGPHIRLNLGIRMPIFTQTWESWMDTYFHVGMPIFTMNIGIWVSIFTWISAPPCVNSRENGHPGCPFLGTPIFTWHRYGRYGHSRTGFWAEEYFCLRTNYTQRRRPQPFIVAWCPVSEAWVTPRQQWPPGHWCLRIKWPPPF